MFEHPLLSIVVALFIVYLTIFLLFLIHKANIKPLKTKAFVINLAKNSERLERFYYFYNNSDISAIPVERFDAILGTALDIQKYVSKHAYDTLIENEKNKYRTRHYQITRGAVGCYLSHSTLYRRLIDDNDVDYYLIFEDDASVLPVIKDRIQTALNKVPANWDMIIFAPIMKVVSSNDLLFEKYNTFWGLCSYAIRKKCARKFIDELNNKPISMQIDSKISLMIQNKQLNVYGYKPKTVWHDRTLSTDIQMQLVKQDGIDPFILQEI